MLNAHQIAFRDQAQPERLDHIKYLSAPVGSGKTAAIINDVRDNQNQNYIFVSPTRPLAREIKNRLDIALVNHGQGDNVKLIISEEDDLDPTPIRERVLKEIFNRVGNQHHTLVITTETFRNVLSDIPDDVKALYSVFLDEGIDAIDQVSIATKNQELFLAPISIEDDGSLSVAHGSKELLETVAFNPSRLVAIEREELQVDSFRALAKLLVADLYDVYGQVLKGSIRAVAFLRPDHFLAFRSVTMIMAIFEQSLLALFWSKKYGIDFRPYETSHDLFDTHKEKGSQIHIHFVLHPDDNASSLNLQRDYETGEKNARPNSGRRVIDYAAREIQKRFGDIPYCWTANGYFSNQGRILDGERMPVKCAGLDEFRRYDTVVSLACMNPAPWVKDLVVKQVQISDAKLYELWKLAYTYQTVGRCSLRDRTSQRPIDVVVISRNCAENIQALFHGSEIVGQLTDLPSYESMRKRRGPAKNPSPYSRADDVAWSRFNKDNPLGLEKHQWFEQKRKPSRQSGRMM